MHLETEQLLATLFLSVIKNWSKTKASETENMRFNKTSVSTTQQKPMLKANRNLILVKL